MRIALQDGRIKFELGRHTDGNGRRMRFRDFASADQFLRRFRDDVGDMLKLRQLATDISAPTFHRLGDEELIKALAHAIVRGRILLISEVIPEVQPLAKWTQEAPPAPAPRKGGSDAPPPSEPPTFPAGSDALAQAAALKAAAQDGTPFCEECEKAKAAQAAEAAQAKDSAAPPTPDKAPAPAPPTPTVKITTPLRLISKGKSHKFQATGTPEGGTFKWKTTGSAAVGSGGTSPEAKIDGSAASGAKDDSEITVEYTAGGLTATDTVKVTVYEVSKIEAVLERSLCRGAAAGDMPAKSSTKDSKTIDASAITIVRGCGDLKLTATIAPAGVPVSWAVDRAADDAAGLAGPPTDAADGSDLKHKLTADGVGSFHVTAFVDDDGDGKRGADEGGIILNVNIVDAEVMPGAASNQVTSRNTLFRKNRSTAGALVVDSGSTGGTAPGVNAAYTDAEFLKHPLTMKMTIRLVGGGADKLRGTAEVRLGYIQTTTADSVTGTYADGRTLAEVIVQNAATADPITGGAPAMLAFPVRDTRGAGDNASGPFIISSSDVDKSNVPTGGLQRIVRYVDPPAIVLNMKHPVTNSNLASIAGSNDFAVFLSAYSTDFDANYAVVAEAAWSATYGTFTAAGGWTNAGAAITAPASMTVHAPPKRAADTTVERCPPNFVDNIKMDAR